MTILLFGVVRPALLLLIDFEKAYDSLSWSFMKNVLKSLFFCPSKTQKISKFYNKMQVAIYQGGNLSSFYIERGFK